MKKLILAAALLAISTTSQAYYDGNQLKEGADAYRDPHSHSAETIDIGEFMGAVNGVGQSLELSGITCSPGNTRMKQDFQIVLNYLDAHPEQWTAPAAGLIRSALIQAYPCTKPQIKTSTTEYKY